MSYSTSYDSRGKANRPKYKENKRAYKIIYLTANLAFFVSFLSFMARNNQAMADGITPSVLDDSSLPIIV